MLQSPHYWRCTVNSRVKSGLVKTGAFVSASFSFSKASCCSALHCHAWVFLMSISSGSLISLFLSMNLEYQPTIPMNRLSCLLVLGSGYCKISSTRSGSGLRLSRSNRYRRYLTLEHPNSPFFQFTVNCAFRIFVNTISSHFWCSSNVSVTIMMSR